MIMGVGLMMKLLLFTYYVHSAYLTYFPQESSRCYRGEQCQDHKSQWNWLSWHSLIVSSCSIRHYYAQSATASRADATTE